MGATTIGSWYWVADPVTRRYAEELATRVPIRFFHQGRLFTTAAGERAISRLELWYAGNPVAIGKAWDRWLEALAIPGRGCVRDACYWDDGDVQVASVLRRRGWTGKDELFVTLYR